MKWITNGNCDEKEQWHYWYAWYPVHMPFPDGRFQWIWLERLQRRYCYDGWDSFYWEYRYCKKEATE